MGNYKPKFEIRIYWSPSEGCYFAAIPELWGCGQSGKSPQGALNKLLPLIPVYVDQARMGNFEIPAAHVKTIEVWEGPLPELLVKPKTLEIGSIPDLARDFEAASATTQEQPVKAAGDVIHIPLHVQAMASGGRPEPQEQPSDVAAQLPAGDPKHGS